MKISKTMLVPPNSLYTYKSEGDAGMVVATYKMGNTIVKINDAFVAKTPEERERVDIEIATAAYACLLDDIQLDEKPEQILYSQW